MPVNVTTSPWRAHPRSRGEHEEKPPHPQNHPGSSPLARGTHRRGYSSPRVRGLIPARAGNTCTIATAATLTWAHPRSRGEHWRSKERVYAHRGSSPLARGTLEISPIMLFCGGLIPARAGNTCRARGASPPPWAHPRSRGEHLAPSTPELERRGSSPLARGTLMSVQGAERTAGLIPARAGNTAVAPSGGGVMRAHPRSRGEHTC